MRTAMANWPPSPGHGRQISAFQMLAKNALQEPTYVALAVSDGELFVRTHEHLYRINDFIDFDRLGRRLQQASH